MDVTTSVINKLIVVSAAGEVDNMTAPKVIDAVNDALAIGGTQFVIDLSGVTFIDSSGLRSIIVSNKRIKEHNGALRVVIATSRISKVFRITGLDKVYDVFTTVEEATQTSL